ncbi:MAG TPA: AMP-binding protein, partial [Pyrinomonadaceae bacterium]
MKHENVYQLFDRRAEELPDHPALARAGAGVTYRELRERTNRLANFLIASGVEKGSVVAVLTRDTAQAITAVVAVLKAGGVFVPLDPDIPERRLRTMIEEVTPGWFVVDSEFLHVTLPTHQNGRPKARVLLLDGGREGAADAA